MTRRFPEGVSRDAGFLDGHFDGAPIVPGAVLLAFAADKLVSCGHRVTGLARAKFLRSLAPCTPFDIEISVSNGRAVALWTSAEAKIAEARFVLETQNV